MGPESKGAESLTYAAKTLGEIYFYPEDQEKEPQCTREYGGSPWFSSFFFFFLTQPCTAANPSLRSALPRGTRKIDNLSSPIY